MQAVIAALSVGASPGYPVNTAYSYHGCLPGSPGACLQWCNFSMSHTARIQSLLEELTVSEKIGLLGPDPSLGSECNDHTAGAPRVGLTPYMWLVETNTGANSECLSNGAGEHKCATTFNGPLGMGASFNRTSWRLKGGVIGTELRAFNNMGWNRDAGGTTTEKIGLTGYGPNINNPRDPRFGRLSELPSEDPYHAGHYAVQELAGAQEMDENGHPKMISFLKHFTAYSMETDRMHSKPVVSAFDMHDSFLPQYKIAFTEGTARGGMCSYDAINGRPSCANDYILKTQLREAWNSPDAFISTDCGAVKNMRGPPANAPTDEAAVAWTINNGTDLEMGTSLVNSSLGKALAEGLITEATITEAARRTLVHLFAAGRFDRIADIEWSKYGADDVASDLHYQIRDEAALQSFVLLKNEKEMLPLKAGTKVAVIGPQSTGTGLFSDYYGDDICPGSKGGKHHNSAMGCVTTIAAAITAANVGGTTTNATGVTMTGSPKDPATMVYALGVAKAADVVVLALGIDKSVEHEGVDRKDIKLPGMQSELAKAVFKLGKPVILVLTNGGPLAIDDLIDGADAIVEAFNPAFGAPMLAKTLFGAENRWGKLPYTIYPEQYISQIALDDYDMTKAPGRTYRYYTGKPLFEYGQGLSYTTFGMQCKCSAGVCSTPPMNFSCVVRNTGTVAGDEVVMVFHQASDAMRKAADHPIPLKSLVQFDRVSLARGASTTITFTLPKAAFELTTTDGNKTVIPGQRNILFSRGTGVDVSIPVTL